MALKAPTFPVQPSAYDAEAVSLASTDYTPAVIGRGVYVGGAGDVALTTGAGTAVTFTAVPAGTLIPIFFTSIQKTGTTATSLLALS
jgi:hypothetical protein